MHRLVRLSLVFVGLFFAGASFANVPAAYFACEGAGEGDACDLVGGTRGNCTRDTDCVSRPDIVVDQCLLCVDGCWAGLDRGARCMTINGGDGVCAFQGPHLCTGRDETSFNECMRCSPDSCEGLADGDECLLPFEGRGVCARDEICGDDEACRRCVSTCQVEGEADVECVLADGNEGVCAVGDGEDDPSTSFDDRLRCVPGEVPTKASSGCAFGGAPLSGGIWAIVLLAGLVQLRRRRQAA